VDNKGKPKSLTASDKINILVQVDAHTGTHVEQMSWLRLPLPTLNLIVKNHEEIERRYVQCGPSSKQWKALRCLPLEKLESVLAAWFKQACENNASIDAYRSLSSECRHVVQTL
jgi:hypothetical protein